MILYFTGTGNSEYVAKRIAAATGDLLAPIMSKIRDHDHRPMVSAKPWVVCAPTYGWQMPHIVRDWLLKTPLHGSRMIYFVLTCGTGMGNAAHYAQSLGAEKLMDFYGCMQIVMPENYLAMFDVPDQEEARRIVMAAEPSINAAIEAIGDRKGFTPHKATLPGKLQSSVVNAAYYPLFVHSRRFRVKETCNGCGLCKMLCPMGAIELRSGKPKWKDPCTHCMACICHCPKGAIEYGRASVGKPRYICPVD